MSTSVSIDDINQTAVKFYKHDDPVITYSKLSRPSANMRVSNVVVVSPNEYTGDYTAIPSDADQVFGTKGKSMSGDFKVTKVMTHEANNDFSITFTIGE